MLPTRRGEFRGPEPQVPGQGELFPATPAMQPVYRGMRIHAGDLGDIAADRSQSPQRRAGAVLEYLRSPSGQEKYGGGHTGAGAGGRLGQHWSSDPHTALGYSSGATDSDYDWQPGSVSVVLHAERPPVSKQVTGSRGLSRIEAFGEGAHSEREVSFRRNAAVNLTGVTFPDWERGDTTPIGSGVPQTHVPLNEKFKA
jgi:hypothetical protein